MKILSILLSFVFLFGCSSNDNDFLVNDPTDDDFLIFGYILGECVLDCSELHLLTSNSLYRDSDSLYVNSGDRVADIILHGELLTNEEFEIAEVLWALPESLVLNDVGDHALLNTIMDVDLLLNGSLGENEFNILYDEIDPDENEDLYNYNIVLQNVLEQLQ